MQVKFWQSQNDLMSKSEHTMVDFKGFIEDEAQANWLEVCHVENGWSRVLMPFSLCSKLATSHTKVCCQKGVQHCNPLHKVTKYDSGGGIGNGYPKHGFLDVLVAKLIHPLGWHSNGNVSLYLHSFTYYLRSPITQPMYMLMLMIGHWYVVQDGNIIEMASRPTTNLSQSVHLRWIVGVVEISSSESHRIELDGG